MENRIGNSDGAEIPKKSRSLDLKSLYKSKVSMESLHKKDLKRKIISEERDVEKSKKRKKSSKTASISSSKNVDNTKKSLDEVYNGVVSSGSHNSKDSKLELSHKPDSSSRFDGISFNLNDSVVRIPRRKRGFVGRKKVEIGQVLNPPGQSYSKAGIVDQVANVSGDDSSAQVKSLKDLGTRVESPKDSGTQVESSTDQGVQVESPKDLGARVESVKVKRKKGFEDFKENRKRELNSARILKEEGGNASHSVLSYGESSLKKENRNSESSLNRQSNEEGGDVCHSIMTNGDSSLKKSSRISNSNLARCLKDDDVYGGQLVVKNSGSSLKKSRRNHGKRKDSARDRSSAKEAEPLNDTSVKVCADLLEDEENLEENAAMMLSSRFDPSCTGFSSNGKSTNGLSFLLSSGRDFGSRESALFDAAGRALRPRTQHNEKGHPRKRRHYYEVFSGDLDAYWVLNRRIKVFWPLDQCWYYGLVNDYDKEKKLHHVKYDDRDEEWINLENERFKLLLLPSEVPGKGARRRSKIRGKYSDEGKGSLKPSKEKEKRNSTTEEDNCLGSYMDSEPIISWLARTNRRVKSSPFHAMKKQKISDPSLTLETPFLSDEVLDVHANLDGASLSANCQRSSCKSELLDGYADGVRGKESTSESPSCSKDGKFPIVYYRRRFRKTGSLMCLKSSSNNIHSSVPASVSSVDGFGDLEDHDISLKILNPDGALWSTDNAGLLNLTTLMESRCIRFLLSFPELSFLNYVFGSENIWLFRAVFLLHYGTLMTTWPMVQLEILFVDNVVGLRFFLFEGCLLQAVAYAFLVLGTFHQPDQQGKFAELRLPATSVSFKFSCIDNLAKQFVFAFYSFTDVKNSMWMYLDSKLNRLCRLSKQLPLSECTYDNVKALQNGSNRLFTTSVSGDDFSTKGLQRCKKGICFMGVSRGSPCVKVSQFSSNSDKKQTNFPPFSLSFSAAPTFFLNLHLKLLMEHRVAHFSFQNHDLTDHPELLGTLMVDDCSSLEHCANKGSESSHENDVSESALESNVKDTLKDAATDGHLSAAKSELPAIGLSVCNDGNWVNSPQKYGNGDLNVAGTSAASEDPKKIGSETIVPLQKWQCDSPKLEQCVSSPRPSVDSADDGSHSPLNGIRVEIPAFDQFDKNGDREFHSAQRSTDLSWNMNGGIIPSPNPTAPRSTWHRHRSSSSSFGYHTHGWSDGKADIVHNNFGNGPKKPRTQVSYSLPFGGFDYSSRNRSQQQKGLPHMGIRRANEKRLSDVSRGSQKNLEMLCCDANVLITHGDKGWRECGAQVVLELFDHSEWKLAIKLSGTTRYSYKAHQFLQPGSTNRYTHAMMWKGGKDWILEFPDRSQWFLFKEMHEECYNRNIRAALVKNIPIPGVRMIEEFDDNGTEVAFVRGSSKYFRQLQTDVEMALDPSRVLYDMDSDDEQWILKICNCSEANSRGLEISEDLFEKTMDRFEKAAYSQRQDLFTSDEMEELMAGDGSMEAIKSIYEHWRQKRRKKGMPLIRHLQPPLWERYQQQLKEWEQAMSKTNSTFRNGCHGKVAPCEKPPMFAFCLKPRGLEVPNKGSKQRSHRKISVSGQSNAVIGDHDGFHTFGRRLNGFIFGDEKVVYHGHNYESLDDSPLSQTSPRVFSPRVFSPRDAGSMAYFSMGGDGFDRNQYQKLQRSKTKKFGTFEFSYDTQMLGPYNQRLTGKKNGIHRWNMGYASWPSQSAHLYSDSFQRHGYEQLDGSDFDEFRLRDASGAAQHARNMAKLKREKAQRLLYRADLAINKAVNALIIAEAIKTSFDDVNSDG